MKYYCCDCYEELEKINIFLADAKLVGRKFVSDKKYCTKCFNARRTCPTIASFPEPDRGPLGSFLDSD